MFFVSALHEAIFASPRWTTTVSMLDLSLPTSLADQMTLKPSIGREEGFRCGEVFHAEGDVINADGFFHGGSSYAASVNGGHAICLRRSHP